MMIVVVIKEHAGDDNYECANVMQGIAEYQQLIKAFGSPRFGLIATTDSTPNVLIELDDPTYNDVSVDTILLYLNTRRALYKYIQELPCNNGSPTGTDLAAAIEEARNQFATKKIPGQNREEKIVIFSSCTDTVVGESGICTTYQDGIYDGTQNVQHDDGDEIEVTIINLQNVGSSNVDDDYLKCLTGNEDSRLYTIQHASDINNYECTYIEFKDEICSEPSPSPTTDPTIDPTRDPTSDPTRDPTSDPTADPTRDPTSDPTIDPTRDPTTDPTIDPTSDPTKDPTRDPTSDPTKDPTADPTIDPTADPTRDPTSDPTRDPTKDPTSDPTTDPTRYPTASPTRADCEITFNLDIIFMVDVGCGSVTVDECTNQQELVAEIFSSIRDQINNSREQVNNNVDKFRVRVAYTEYGNIGQTPEYGGEFEIIIPFRDEGVTNYNSFLEADSFSDAQLNAFSMQYYQFIKR